MKLCTKIKAFIRDKIIRKQSLDILKDATLLLLQDAAPLVTLAGRIAQFPYLLREQLFWHKMDCFLRGLSITPEDQKALRERFSENKGIDENIRRLLSYIDQIESDEKIHYLANATRCLIEGEINTLLYFKICGIITRTLPEDLVFIKDHMMDPPSDPNIAKPEFRYSLFTETLSVGGLVTISGIGGFRDGYYSFTKMAEIVDACALSYGDPTRYPNGPKPIITEHLCKTTM